ncbi:Cytosolic carboxypeptidase 2 [Taenia solium]|eukprot:TsM_000908700 transcript=TsM_000908700 gene=TsM_000908700
MEQLPNRKRMIPHELAFPGHLTPPDIQAYQQFSNQSGNPLFSPNRLHSLRKAPPLLLDGIDGRLNPESFYYKSKSASKQRQNLLMQEILPEYRLEERRTCDSFVINGSEIRRPNSIHQAVEAYMRRSSIKNSSNVDRNTKTEASCGPLMPEPSLHTWRMTNEIVDLLLEGQISWEQIEANFKCHEPEKHEIESFCQLSPLQKKTIHFGSSKLGFLVSVKRKNVCFDITDRWGVRRNIDGPFWPFGLGPLGPPPSLRDGVELWGFERARQVRDRVLSKLEYLFVRRSIGEVEDGVTLKRPIVVFDTESSPPMEVRMRRVDVLKEEGELVFESRFESGNLKQARRMQTIIKKRFVKTNSRMYFSGTYEYELVLTPDLVTESHVQWFFFQVAGAKCGVEYTFHIVNLLKTKRLVKTGEKVLFYSKKLAEKTGNGWTRVGTDTSYGRNLKAEKNPILKRGTTYYELKWNMSRDKSETAKEPVFPYDNDVCVFAHCYPYTYSDLKADIHDMMQRARKLPPGSVRCEKLCSTFAGNTCFLITITDPDSEKWAAVLTARVHPGETVGSWNMKGLMELLTHPRNDKAKELRRRYVFKLVPMLNADGVIVGNYRCSLVGRDVNRTYTIYGPDRIPEVHYTRKLVEHCRETCKDVIFCDFHGHSQAFNAFIYGTDSGYRSASIGGVIEPPKTYLTNPKQYLVDRMIPFLISKQDPRRFSFRNCRFSLQPWREGCARITLWRKFNLTHCFTMETSLFGTNLEPGTSLRYFDRGDLQTLGQSVVLALLEFHKIRSNETYAYIGKLIGQLEFNGDLENNIGSVDDFANAFNEYGDLLVEGDEVDSSSASDASSIHESEFILEKTQNMDVRESSAPVMKRKRRHRKHRKCRRRRKNRRRRLARLKSVSGNPSKMPSMGSYE